MSRRNGSSSRAVDIASKNRLHMDRNQPHARITDPSLAAGRRKEIDNVMKRARAASPGVWDRKLLEVEEKDPNRWRHTGYKQLYLDGSTSRSPSPRRSRSPVRRSRSAVRRSRSPVRRSRSPVRRSRSPVRRSRSPVRRSPVRRTRSPARRSRSAGRRVVSPPIHRRGSPVRRSPVRRSPPPRTRSPLPWRSRSPVRGRRTPPPQPLRRASPAVRPERRDAGVVRRESPSRARPAARARAPAAPARPARPPSPPPQRKQPAAAPQRSPSSSSCSNESCSVCTPKNKRRSASPARRRPPPKPLNSGNAAAQPSSLSMRPTKELLKEREANKRTREEKVLEWQRSQLAVQRRIKREGERGGGGGGAARAVSPAAVAAALGRDDDDESSASSEPPPGKMTLSERFGKMAQWSADRSATIENMRITRRSAGLHVHIERPGGEGGLADDDGTPPPERYAHSPAPVGSYPEELLAAPPGDLPSWDDVRVRYDYYKKRGYLRGLTLSDYVKWEEWWYKYQEWLKRERAYERWVSGEERGGRRKKRRRLRRDS